MDHPLRRVPALLIVAVLVACACVREADSSLLGNGLQPDGSLNDKIDKPLSPSAPTKDKLKPDLVVQAALEDVEGYWSRTYPLVYGGDYVPIKGGFWPYGPDTRSPPCGQPPPTYEQIKGNAFYCVASDLVAWDAKALIPELYDKFGPFTVGIVFAHELGHAIQVRADVRAPTIILELQADCFAGAWSKDVEAGHAKFFKVSVVDLDASVAGFLELRDGIGTDQADPLAHGTGFDRVSAFQDGFEKGPSFCRDYATAPPVITEVPFTSADDFNRGGNLPLDQVIPLSIEDLEDFWSVRFAALGKRWTPLKRARGFDASKDKVLCGGKALSKSVLKGASLYCAADDVILYDTSTLIPDLYAIGDYAVTTELAKDYAHAAQARLGIHATTLQTNLEADCLSGLFAFSGFQGDRPHQALFLSPGDLDESIVGFLAFGDRSTKAAPVGTAFERVDAFRTGFLQGYDACAAILKGR